MKTKPYFILPVIFAAFATSSMYAEQVPLTGTSSTYGSALSMDGGATQSEAPNNYWTLSGAFTVDADFTLTKTFSSSSTATTCAMLFAANKTLTVQEGATFTINTNRNGASGETLKLTNATIDGTLISKYNGTTTYQDAANGNIVVNGVIASDRYRIKNGTTTVSTTAGKASFRANYIDSRGYSSSNCKLVLNSEFAVVNSTGTQYNTAIQMMINNAAGKLNIDVGASQQFGEIQFQKNTSSTSNTAFNFTNSSAYCIFTDITTSEISGRELDGTTTSLISLANYDNNIYFTTDLSSRLVSYGEGQAITTSKNGKTGYVMLSGTDTQNNEIESFNFVKTSVLDASGNSLSAWQLVAVPEPSVYAAILGALALGFAMYRRRK